LSDTSSYNQASEELIRQQQLKIDELQHALQISHQVQQKLLEQQNAINGHSSIMTFKGWQIFPRDRKKE
jgi:hypothetical protein